MTESESTRILKAMSHPARLRILRALRGGALCAGKTNDVACLSQPNLSQHLKVLRESGLVGTAKIGTRHCHYIALPRLVDAFFESMDAEHEPVVKTADEVRDEACRREGETL